MADVLVSIRRERIHITAVTKKGTQWLADNFKDAVIKVERPREHLDDFLLLAKNAEVEVEAH